LRVSSHKILGPIFVPSIFFYVLGKQWAYLGSIAMAALPGVAPSAIRGAVNSTEYSEDLEAMRTPHSMLLRYFFAELVGG
jgi:hypothetical protein